MDNRLFLLAAAILGPLVSFLVAAKRFSGRIDSTEASKLWDESAAMREALQGQLDSALKRVTRLEERAARAESDNNSLQARNIALDRQALEYQRTIDEQRRQIDQLQREVHDLQTLVKQLQEAA